MSFLFSSSDWKKNTCQSAVEHGNLPNKTIGEMGVGKEEKKKRPAVKKK